MVERLKRKERLLGKIIGETDGELTPEKVKALRGREEFERFKESHCKKGG